MNRIAQFEKVSFEQFSADMSVHMHDISAREAYDGIIMPRRATTGSAGYDLYLPADITLKAGQTMTVPTGIRAFIEDGWFLMCCPRSGLGFKYRLRMDNTVGIIDGDYYNAENEGHIIIKVTNENTEGKELVLPAGKAFAQGIFLPYGITMDDNADGLRRGGFGSSG